MDEHTVEPEAGSIVPDGGIMLGADSGTCAYCGQPAEGDDRGWYHAERGEPKRCQWCGHHRGYHAEDCDRP